MLLERGLLSDDTDSRDAEEAAAGVDGCMAATGSVFCGGGLYDCGCGCGSVLLAAVVCGFGVEWVVGLSAFGLLGGIRTYVPG